MALDKKQRSKVSKAITLNLFVLVIVIFIGVLYILPKYEALGLMVRDINESYSSYTKMLNDGVDATGYQSLLSKHTSLKKTVKDPNEILAINTALKKPQDVATEYLNWTQEELNTSSNYDAEIDRNNRIIGNIIPTYSDMSSDSDDSFQKNRITLKDIVRYVEEELLKKNKLLSYSPVSLASVTFDNTGSSTLNIGTYKIILEVQGENRNIVNLVKFIQSSGKLQLKDGKLVDTATSGSGSNGDNQGIDFSNLLITIKSARFSTPLTNTTEENKATLELQFYVRGQSYSDFIEIRKKISEQVKELQKKIEVDGGICANATNPICVNENVFRAISSIKSIKDDVTSIDTKLTEALKNTTVKDINSELNTLFTTYTTFKSLEATYQKNKDIISSAQK